MTEDEKKAWIWFGDPTGRIATFAVLPADPSQGIKPKTGDDCLRYGAFPYARLREGALAVWNIPLRDAAIIARSYGKERFFFGKTTKEADGVPVSELSCYQTAGGRGTYRRSEPTRSVTTCEDADDFFEAHGAPLTFRPASFADSVPAVRNQKAFGDSLDEERTFRSRAMHRREAYRG